MAFTDTEKYIFQNKYVGCLRRVVQEKKKTKQNNFIMAGNRKLYGIQCHAQMSLYYFLEKEMPM